MWPFTKNRASLEQDAILSSCNFELARDEFADFFHTMSEEAKRDGKEMVFRTELVQGWKQFSANPRLETAKTWLKLMHGEGAPILKVFADCCPGGRAASHAALQQRLSAGDRSSSSRSAASKSPKPAYTFGDGDGLTPATAVKIIPHDLTGLRETFKSTLRGRVAPEMVTPVAIDSMIAEMCKMAWLDAQFGDRSNSGWECGERQYLADSKQSQVVTLHGRPPVTVFFDFILFHPNGWQ